MPVLSTAWGAWCWLPAFVQVPLAALVWFAFAELIGLFCSANTRCEVLSLDKEREQRRAEFARVQQLPQARRAHRLGGAR